MKRWARRAAITLGATLAYFAAPEPAHAGGSKSSSEHVDEQAGTTVVLLPIEADGLPAADRESIEARFRQALEHPDIELLTPSPTTACPDESCMPELGREQHASHVVRVVIVAHGRDFDATIVIVEVEGGQPATSIDAGCLICGFAEFGDCLATGAVSARELILTAEHNGPIRIVGQPTNARLRIDGQSYGRLPWEGELSVGEHELELRSPGYRPRVVSLAPVPGVEQLIEVELAPKPLPRWRRPVGWTSLIVGAASLGVGAYLISIDGQPVARRCNSDEPGVIDRQGDCRWLHRTMGAGIGLTVAGITTATAGLTLIAIDAQQRLARTRDGRFDPELQPQLRVGLGFNRLELRLRF